MRRSRSADETYHPNGDPFSYSWNTFAAPDVSGGASNTWPVTWFTPASEVKPTVNFSGSTRLGAREAPLVAGGATSIKSPTGGVVGALTARDGAPDVGNET